MSRLYDRIRAEGCRPWRFTDFPPRPAAGPGEVRPEGARFPEATEALAPGLLEGAFVVVADDVVCYLDQHRESVRTFDIITNVAPPHPKLFLEFEAVGVYKVRHGLHAWGVLVDAVDLVGPEWEAEGARWGLELRVVLELRKGEICGPVAVARLFARPDGTLDRFSPQGQAIGGHDWVDCDPQWFVTDAPDRFTAEMEQALWELTVPALFTLSLMHARNVTVTPVDPPPAHNRRARRRRGAPPVRYHVLDIEPMRQLLDSEGQGASNGLSHAVHVCRGHFKRYSADAPLFGRYTGQWWWAQHRRGRSELGEVAKDYRMRLHGFGAPYRRAGDQLASAGAAEAHRSDADSDCAGGGPEACAVTQDAFADALEAAGVTPRSAKSGEPDFDVGWQVDAAVWVGVVRSLTPTGEEQQPGEALASLLRCRQRLADLGHRVRTVVIVDAQPTDAAWETRLGQQGVAVVWPERFAAFVADSVGRRRGP